MSESMIYQDAKPRYKRVLLKLSGEYLKGESGFTYDSEIISQIVGDIKEVVELGVQVGIVIGGGNIVRGADVERMERADADFIGMMATLVNALTLKGELEAQGIAACVMGSFEVRGIEVFSRAQALKNFESGKVVIFGGGTGNPFFTTDTAAALRASEISAEIVLKGTKVDGVYSSDPKKDPYAIRYDKLSYLEAISRDLRVMDMTAIALCRENRLPIIVFNLDKPGNVLRAICGEPVGTLLQ